MSAVRPGRIARKTQQSGFTMVEVLVTFVILAIGILGIVTLLVTSKSSEFEAAQRARAVHLAEELVEKIRSNPRAVLAYETGMTHSVSGSEPSPNCNTSACTTPAQLAAWDLWIWRRALEGNDVSIGATPTAGLQEAGGCIEFFPHGSYARTGQLRVHVQWTGLLDTGSGLTSAGDFCGPSGELALRRAVVATTFIVDPTE